MISHKDLVHLLQYEAATGKLLWRNPPTKNLKQGKEAGCLSDWGYRKIGLKGRLYYAHRLVWFYHYKAWPKHQIDHIDRDKKNNRIENLRDVEQTHNMHNTSKGRGVTFLSGGNRVRRWYACIEVGGKRIGLGCHHTKKDAMAAYAAAKAGLQPA